MIAIKPATTELVLPGRGLLPLADLADLVTEMRPVKHYFDEGLLARQGIEY
nr:cob(I)yrinic acid a,c-diamide adenosyltransferase [Collinsella aerofaciens]